MSRMICVSTPRVKPSRRTYREPSPFGQGILPGRPPAGRDVFIPSPDDRSWAAATAAEPNWDDLARESAMQDRLCRGPLL
jgi:hypothetical protein